MTSATAAGTGDLPPRLLLETTALTRPGQERGLGRYARACLEGAHELGLDITELSVRLRTGRVAEFSDLIERSLTSLVHRHDIFHVTNPLVWSPSISPTVASILDLIPLDMPSYRQTGIKNSVFYSRAAHAHVILTISNFTAERIVDHFHVNPERIVVAPLFPATTFHIDEETSPPMDLPRNYVISLVDMATHDPRKRATWIAPLARDLGRAGIGLVLVGAGTNREPSEIGDAKGIGRVSDKQLARLIRRAVCFLYFSAYEGQGLPPLEAMFAGTAVVSTANTAVTEVIQDGGILIDEHAGHWSAALREDSKAEATRKDLVDACVAIRQDDSLRADLQSRGRARATEFSKSRFADGLSSAYRLATCK
jgi:glycosyltransferase involved in cell wall biosynthesis